MHGERSFDLMVARAGITVSGRRPVDYPAYGRGLQQPESGAMGGSQFQHHRSNYAPTYVCNAIPTETGYVSVDYELANPRLLMMGNVQGQRLAYVNSCCPGYKWPEEVTLYNAAEVQSIVPTPSGEIVFTKARKLFRYENLICTKELHVKGIDIEACALIGFSSVGGRLLAFSCTDIYVSSAENQLDFTPSLRTQAQSFTIRYNIGAIFSIVPVGEVSYVFGSRGAAVLQCSGDAQFPLKVSMVADFPGIEHPRNVEVDYPASSFYAWTRAGLMIVQGSNAQPAELPDISEALSEQRLVVFHADDGFDDTARSHTDGLQTLNLQTRDDLCLTQPSTLVKERVVPRGVIAVRNVNPRFCAISYGTGLDSVDDGLGVSEGATADLLGTDYSTSTVAASFTRLLLLDVPNQRLTVLHRKHSDVIEDRQQRGGGYGTLLLSSVEGLAYQLIHREGVASVYFKELTGTARKAVKLVGSVLKGEFNLDAYPDVEWAAGSLDVGKQVESEAQRLTETAARLSRIHCIAGQDIPGRNALHNLRLVTKTRGDLHYVGRAIGHTVSTLYEFSGQLSELILRRTQ